MDMLNEAVARELRVSIQYMWQCVAVSGIKSEEVGGVFKKISVAKMKHAEKIVERLDRLGGRVTAKPGPIEVGKSVKEMLQLDKKAEEDGIKFYKEIVSFASDEDDIVTIKLFEHIITEEEEHHYYFSTLLED